MNHPRTGSPHQRTTRGVALVAVLALLASACGSRLTDEQITAFARSGSGTAPQADAAGPDPGAVATEQAGDDTGTAQGPSGDVGAEIGKEGEAANNAGAEDLAPDAQPTTGQGDATEGGSGEAPSDTRAAPPGGNGGATDVGVTEDRILIYNVSDLTGVVPGLFRDAYEATLAYIQYFTATEGTVYGRQIVLESRDSQLSSQGNRSAYLDACENAFAVVGSMSAFEEGAAEPLESCGLPDLRNTPTSEPIQTLRNSLGTFGLRAGDISMSEWIYYKEQFPDAVANAGFVWLENTTTNYQTDLYIRGTTPIGYDWREQIPVATSETNYARIVTRLKDSEIEFVAFQGAYQQAVRLAKSMQQQNYSPQVFALQSNTYTPDLIETCGDACADFVRVAATSSLLEEIDATPELQLYSEWLKRVNPNAEPTGLGMYSWAAAKLFVQALKDIGPEVTRQALLDHLHGVSSYDANGLIPTQNIGSQEAAGCTVILDIQDGRFVREAPANGYQCESTNVS